MPDWLRAVRDCVAAGSKSKLPAEAFKVDVDGTELCAVHWTKVTGCTRADCARVHLDKHATTVKRL